MEVRPKFGLYIKIISHEFEKSRENNLKEFDITSQQMNILILLGCHKNQQIKQKDIETAFCLSRATISGILKRMEAKDYIKRTFIKTNKKEKYIFLSEKGKNIEKEIHSKIMEHEESLLNGFSQEEKQQLLNYLKRIQSNIKEVDQNV